jgi:hypothetical protein
MADKLTLKLTATVYDQPDKDDPNDLTKVTTRREGDVFQATSRAEYDRLIEIGAALDPNAYADQERERLQAELDRIQAQKAVLDEQAAALEADASTPDDPSELKGKALDDALDANGLSKDGTADEKRARLAEHLQAQE